MQTGVIEQQIEKKLTLAHLQRHLPAHVSKASAQLQQKLRDMVNQRPLQLALGMLWRQREKVEQIRVFQQLCRQI